MNKSNQQPNGPGPSMAEQAKFVNGKGTRLVGAPDPSNADLVFRLAALAWLHKGYDHSDRQQDIARRLGYTIGTSHRKARK